MEAREPTVYSYYDQAGHDGKAKIEVSLNMTAKVVSKLPGTKSSADALYVR